MNKAKLQDVMLCVVVIAVALGVLHWQYLVAWVSRSDRSTVEIATWTQAIVASIAIFAGAGAIWWQVRHQQAERDRLTVADEVRRLHIVASGLFHARFLVEVLKTHSANHWPLGVELDLLEKQVEMLASIPALDFPDWRAAYAVAQASSSVATLRDYLGTLHQGIHAHGQLHHQQQPHLDVALMALEGLEDIMRSTLRQRGADLPPQLFTHNGTDYASPTWSPEAA